jgi:hypothetical protein
MNRKGPQRDAKKERFWRDAIRQQQRSGQSVRDYCRNQGLTEPSFYAWRREITGRGCQRAKRVQRRAAKRPAFVSLQLAPGTVPIGSASIECLLPNGVVLRLPAGMEPAAIAALLTSWEQSRC